MFSNINMFPTILSKLHCKFNPCMAIQSSLALNSMENIKVFFCKYLKYISRLMRKQTICICENKDPDQLRGNREADQRLFVFATWIVHFLFFLNPKFQASSLLLLLHSPACVRPGQNPNCWFSQAQAHISYANHFYIKVFILIIHYLHHTDSVESILSVLNCHFIGSIQAWWGIAAERQTPLVWPTETSHPLVVVTQGVHVYWYCSNFDLIGREERIHQIWSCSVGSSEYSFMSIQQIQCT